MTVRVVGAGLGRTGTNSLKLAFEQLLGEPCYHMIEVFGHPEHIAQWQKAVDGEPVDWKALMTGYGAAVDWPAAAFWPELSAAYPDAIVLLSTRTSAEAWWKSANDTIFAVAQRVAPEDPIMREQLAMIVDLFTKRFTADYLDPAAARRAYEAHNELVRASVPAERLIDWQAGDGWEPLCSALGVAIPDTPFPHANTTDDFRAMAGLT